METEDVFTFRQSELPCVSFAVFEDMWKKGEFCDLTIKIQNKSFLAHRMVVAAVIPYFRTVFASHVVETEEKEIAVEELDPGTLGSLINFAYTNAVDISAANAKSLLVASQFLQLDKVRDACVEFLSKRLCIANVSSMHEFADSLDHPKLIESCNLYIRGNFEEFSGSDVFLSLRNSFIRDIISSDDLNVSSEEVVFEALMRWIKASPSERHVALPELLREVRMKYLPVTYLVEKVDTEELIVSSEPCRDLVNEMKRYHLFPSISEAFPVLKTRPRNPLMQDLYVISSRGTCGIFICHFNSVNEEWRHLSCNKTEPECVYNAAAVNGNIYIFLAETIHAFSVKSRKWAVLKSVHSGLKGAAVVSNGNKIYWFGSDTTTSNFSNKICCFDTQQDEWMITGTMKTTLTESSAVSLGEYIYISGGREGKCKPAKNTVAKYDPLTGEWNYIAPMRIPRSDHGSTSLNGKIYVCGGWTTGESLTNTVEVYDPLTNKWNFISPLNSGMWASCSLISYCNKIYVFGQFHKQAKIYDPNRMNGKTAFQLRVPAFNTILTRI